MTGTWILWMPIYLESSSQLTNIFQRGRYTTSQSCCYHSTVSRNTHIHLHRDSTDIGIAARGWTLIYSHRSSISHFYIVFFKFFLCNIEIPDMGKEDAIWDLPRDPRPRGGLDNHMPILFDLRSSGLEVEMTCEQWENSNISVQYIIYWYIYIYVI